MSRRFSVVVTAVVLCVALDACQSPTAPAPRRPIVLAGVRGDGADTTQAAPSDTTVSDTTQPPLKYPTQPWY